MTGIIDVFLADVEWKLAQTSRGGENPATWLEHSVRIFYVLAMFSEWSCMVPMMNS